MSIDSLIPSPEFSEVEMTVINGHLHEPLVQKYFQALSLSNAKELAEVSALGKTPEALAIAHATIRGRLDTLLTLIKPKE